MIKSALLSVIIPVYNVEPYLEQCLDSVVNQTYKDLEIICINDGSTDNSLKVLEKFAQKDKRIKLINQKNKGLSEARNAGLDIAKGEYIAFVDSDDYLELNAYEEAMKVMLDDNKVEVVEFLVNAFSDDHNILTIDRTKASASYIEVGFRLKQHTVWVWNKVFKSDRIQKMNIRFIPNLTGEDIFFTNAYIMLKDKSEFIGKLLYNYRIREGSMMEKQKANHIYYNFDALVDLAIKHGIYEKQKEFIYERYLRKVPKFYNDKSRLNYAIQHFDKKIINSHCPYHLKLKYLQKRKFIERQISNRGNIWFH